MSEFGDRTWAMICYLPVFNVITCVLASVKMVHSKFCLFHARQGLVLFAFWFLTIFVALFSQFLSLILWIVVLVLHAAGFIISLNMQQTELPVVGKLAMRIPAFMLFILLTGKNPEEI